MIRSALTLYPGVTLTVIAMILFLMVFVGWTIWAFDPKRKAALAEWAKIPLNEETSNES